DAGGAEAALEDAEAGGVGGGGDDREAAAGYGAGQQRVLRAFAEPFDLRAEEGQGGVVGERRETGGAEAERRLAHAGERRLHPPGLQRPERDQAHQEVADEQRLAQLEIVLVLGGGGGDAEEEEEEAHEGRDVVVGG